MQGQGINQPHVHVQPHLYDSLHQGACVQPELPDSLCSCMCVQPELHGMVPVEGGQFGGLQRMAMRWPNRLKQAAAVCNSLTLINRNQVVGDAADKQAFKAVEAQFMVRCCSCCLQQRDCRCAACDPDSGLSLPKQL